MISVLDKHHIGLLALVVLAVAGCGLSLGSPTSDPSAQVSTSASPSAGWLTFHSSTEPLSFEYPSDWKVSNTGTADNPDAANLTSADGKQTIRWSAVVQGIGGACPTSCYNIISIAPVAGAACCYRVGFQSKMPGSSLQYGIADTAPTVGDWPPPYPYYAMFKSHHHKDANGAYNEMWLWGDASDTTKQMLSSLVYS